MRSSTTPCSSPMTARLARCPESASRTGRPPDAVTASLRAAASTHTALHLARRVARRRRRLVFGHPSRACSFDYELGQRALEDRPETEAQRVLGGDAARGSALDVYTQFDGKRVRMRRRKGVLFLTQALAN